MVGEYFIKKKDFNFIYFSVDKGIHGTEININICSNCLCKYKLLYIKVIKVDFKAFIFNIGKWRTCSQK